MVHTLSFMHAITPQLTLGMCLMHMVSTLTKSFLTFSSITIVMSLLMLTFIFI